MPYVKKKDFQHLLVDNNIVFRLKTEFHKHDAFVKEYEGTFASRNTNSNFAELKSKRDLLYEILKNTTKLNEGEDSE